MLAAAGIDPVGQRGIHVLQALALRGVIVWGPVVARPGGPSREQYLVLTEDAVGASSSPPDPCAELFARFVDGHGPATAQDFAWWSGLPLTTARAAAEAASGRVAPVDDADEPSYASVGPAPRRSASAPNVQALPPFEESYISYVDRTVVCPPDLLAAVGPGRNGMVRPILTSGGRVVGAWTHSRAVGRHADDPLPELLLPGAAAEADIAAALDRYAAFITG